MTVSEVIAEIVARGEDLSGQPLDPVETLIRKLVTCATQSRRTVLGLNVATDKRFTDEERALCTAAIFERAERMLREEAVKAVANGTSEAGTKKRKKSSGEYESDQHPNVFRREAKDGDKAGWWFCAMVGGKNDEFGPYETKAEANEARISYKKNNVEAVEKAGMPVSVDTPKAKKPKAKKNQDDQISEPTAADAGPGNDAPQEPKSEDTTVKTETKKKTRTAPAKNSRELREGKPSKSSPKAAAGKPKQKSEGKMSALDAAAEVLKGRTKPVSAKELIGLMEEKGLWKSPGGATPDATLSAAIGREIATKGKESRFSKPEPGRFLHA